MDIYSEVTSRIIAEMEKGIIPWEKPWIASGNCVSHATGKAYSLAENIQRACMEVDASIAQNNQNIITAGLHLVTEATDTLKPTMCISSQVCSVEDREAVVVPQLPPDQFEVSGASLLKRIRRLMGWNDNCPRQIMGFAIPEHYAIAFDLQNAVPVQLKPSGGGLPGRRS